MNLRRSAKAFTQEVARGETTVTRIVEQHFDAIAQLNPTLNAYCTVAPEQALEQAAAADKRLALEQPPRALEGVTVCIKDVTPTAGIRTTYGSELYKDHIPNVDNCVVSRLKNAGAIILGKTNTSEFAAGANATNALFGPTRNPWNPELTTGGSTGGGAAAVASSMATLAEGCDMGGSLRIPAAFCGVVGIRPTVGLVPTIPNKTPWDFLEIQGPIARTADDVARMLAVISGHHLDSPLSAPMPVDILDTFEAAKDDSFRIAYAPTICGIHPDSDITQHSESALATLPHAGIDVAVISLDLSEGRDAFIALRGLFIAQNHIDKLDILDQIGPNLRNNLEQGLKLTVAELAAAEHARTRIADTLSSLFHKYDAIITPCMLIEPFPAEQNYPTEINGKPMESYIDWVAQTFLISLASVPAASVPYGISKSGLPLGWQLIGPRWSDGKLLALAERIQELLPIAPPPYSAV